MDEAVDQVTERPHIEATRIGVRFGDTEQGQKVPPPAPVVNGQVALQLPAPDIGVAANTAVDVSVVTDDGAVVTAGQYTYTP